MMHVLIALSMILFCALALPAAPVEANHCAAMPDAYQQANCEIGHQKASGIVGGGIIAPHMGNVPQYSGSPGCVTAGCSGASQEGYFTDTGDTSALNSAGGSAAGTDPRYGEMMTTQTDKTGYNLSTSAPVTTAEANAAGYTGSTGVGSTCIDVQTCTSWTAGTPAIQQCTASGSAVANCHIGVTTTARTLNFTLTMPSPLPIVGWSSPHSVFVHLQSLGGRNYQALIGRGHGSVWSWYTLYTFTAPDPGLAPDEIVVQSSVSVNITVQGDGGPGCGTWTGDVPVGALWEVLACSASGDQSGWARLNSGFGFYDIRKDVIDDGCGGLRASGWLLQTSVCNDNVPRQVTTDTGKVLTLPPPTIFPLNNCWDRDEQWGYQGTAPDTCAPLLSQGCSQIASVCTVPLPGGCDTYQNTFSCPSDSVCASYTTVQQCTDCGTLGSPVPFCVDKTTPPNTNLALAATWLQIAKDIEDDWDPANLRIFTGQRRTCDYDTAGQIIVNCCDTDPSKLFGTCSQEEIDLAYDRQNRKAHFVGTHCVTQVFGMCIRKEEVYCSFRTELARLIHDQGRPQIGKSWGTADTPDCTGFTVPEFTSLNFAAMDFSEWYRNVSASIDPVAITNQMTTKICAYTGTCP